MGSRKPFVIWGSAGHALVLADLLGLQDSRVLAFFDNNPAAVSCLSGVDLYIGEVGFEKWLALQSYPSDIDAAIAIGGARGRDRQYLAGIFERAGLQLPILIHPSATVAKFTSIGDGSQILANAVVAAGASLGKVCIINNSANVDHECQLGNGVHIAPGAVLCGCVIVGDNVMVGAGACVLPKIHIGAGAVIGAGSVVTRNVPTGAVVMGNPAKLSKSR